MPVPSSLHNLMMSVTENNDMPAPPDYLEAVLTKSREVEPGPAVDEMAYWIAARLNMHAVPVKIKTLGLMKHIIERGGPMLAIAFKSMALPVVQHACNFSCPPDPKYGDKPMEMVRKLSNEMVALLNSLSVQKLQKDHEKLKKLLDKERRRKARLGPDEHGYDLSPFVSEKWKPPSQLDFAPPGAAAAPAPAVEEGVPPPQFGLQPAAAQEQLQLEEEPDEDEEEEGLGIFMDVASPVDPQQVTTQRFEIKKGETMGTVKRRMSVTMGVSEAEMAVLMGMGNDPSLDDKTVEEAGVITEGKSFKLPQQAGFAQVQFKGKGKFVPLNLDLKKGTLRMLNNADNSLMRECNVYECAVAEPKKTRKGHKHALRLDLQHTDTAGDDKFVISFLSADDLAQWKENFMAYAGVTEIGAAMMEADADDDDDDEEEEEEDDYDPGQTDTPRVEGQPAPAAFTGVVFSTEVLKEAVALAEKVTTHVDSMLARGCTMYADAHKQVIADMPDTEATKKGTPKRKAAELKAKLVEKAASMEPASAETVDMWRVMLSAAQSQLQELAAEGKKEAKEVAGYLETIETAQSAAEPFFAQVKAEEEQGLDAISKAVDQFANDSDLSWWVGGAEQKAEFNNALAKAKALRADGKAGDGCRELLETLKIAERAVIAGGGARIGARQSSLHPQRWAGELDGVDPWDIPSDEEYEG